MADKTFSGVKWVPVLCGIVMFFFTSMSKVVVPGVLFGDLQALGLGAGALAGLSAFTCGAMR